MAEQKIDFRKTREFGENINDSFLFIRQNFSSLLKSFFSICAIFIIAQAIFSGLYQSQMMNLFQSILSEKISGFNVFAQVGGLNLMLKMLFTLLTLISMQTAVGAYIKFYVQNQGLSASIDEVWGLFRKYFLRIFLYSFPVNLAIILGTCLCFIPGIYLAVVLAPFSLIVMIEETNFGASYRRCFELIRKNFWPSFAIYLVVYLISYFSGYIIGGLMFALISLGAYLTTDELKTPFSIATSFFTLFSVSFYMIYYISASLNYFNLVELREGSGLLSRIENIGRDKNQTGGTEEQY